MTKETEQHTYTRRLTSRVDEDNYNKVVNIAPYGFMTNLMNRFIASIAHKIDAGEFGEVVAWVYTDKDLTLKGDDK